MKEQAAPSVAIHELPVEKPILEIRETGPVAPPLRSPMEQASAREILLEQELAECREALAFSRVRERELAQKLRAFSGDPSPGVAPAPAPANPAADERRFEERLSFLLDLPLVGWRGEMRSTFEYHPVDVSPRGMRLRVPACRVERGEQLDLCLPFRFNGEFLSRGTVRWTDSIDGESLHGVTLSHRQDFQYFIAFDFSFGHPTRCDGPLQNPEKFHEFLYRVLDDAILTKRAMMLYLGHLAPLLARLSRVNRAMLFLLKRTSLDLTEDKIGKNIKLLNELSVQVSSLDSAPARQAFLAHFRRAIQPEIDEFALRMLDKSPETGRYLQSIRRSERRLALHYNAGVLLVEGFAHRDLPFAA